MHLRHFRHGIPILLASGAVFLVSQYEKQSDTTPRHHTVSTGEVKVAAGALPSVRKDLVNSSERQDFHVSEIRASKAPGSRLAPVLEAYQSGDKAIPARMVQGLLDHGVGQAVSLDFGTFQLAGSVVARDRTDGITQMAVDLDDGMGRFQMSHRMDSQVIAALFFTDEEVAFRFQGKPANGHWPLELSSVSQILCAKPGTTYPFHGPLSAMPLSSKNVQAASSGDSASGEATSVVSLSSDPDSTYVLYMDFDGEKLSHPWWTGAAIIDVDPHERAYDEGFVTRVWRRVAEDFAPFDLNVTTDRSVYDMASIERRVLVIVTPTNLVAPGAGGVAYLQTFGMNVPCWAFNADEGSCAETVSHEVGHTLGLDHDGKVGVNEYYGGHGKGKTSWAPIMGAYFADPEPPFVEDEVTQWSKGEYPGATNEEDDLVIITSQNGFSYRTDDHGNNADKASDLGIEFGRVSDQGVITTNTDSDWFQFSTSGGTAYFNAKVLDIRSSGHDPGGANLAVNLSIVDRRGEVVASSTDREVLDAEVGASLTSGVYYLRVKGAGRGNLATSFGKYASLGQYSLGGWVPHAGVVRVTTEGLELSHDSQASSFSVIESGEWTWSSDAQWLVVDAPKSIRGNRQLYFTVSRNSSKTPRSAIVTILSGEHVARMHVTQSGLVGLDDHADDFPDATSVALGSTTEGVLEASGDVDMFRIDLEESGYLSLRTTGDTDTFGVLYDAAGKTLASNDNSNAPNFGIRQLVASGTYYVAVRHASGGSGGKYAIVAGLDEEAVFTVQDLDTVAGPSGGNYSFDVYADGAWRWRSNVPWITSALGNSQTDGAFFGFTVARNNGSATRRGAITLFNEGMTINHTVIQYASDLDDHGNTLSQATGLGIGQTVSGVINYESDMDLFKISTNRSGLLIVDSQLNSDVKGRLLDAEGRELARNDDFNSSNFGIRHQVSAGDYYIEVLHADPQATGDYKVSASLEHSRLVDLAYRATQGGLVRGPKEQTVPFQGDARPVVAVPKSGFRFLGWSDGVRTARRADTRLLSHISVEALFEPSVILSAKGLDHMAGTSRFTLDFRGVQPGRETEKTIRIRNLGKTPLHDFRATPYVSGTDSKWTLKGLEGLTLAPGKSAEIRISCRPSAGESITTARYRISAKGLANALILTAEARFLTTRSAKVSGPPGELAQPKLAVAPVEASPQSVDVPWIEASADGYFRYRFHRALDEKSDPDFQISINGRDWEDALVLDVWKIGTTEKSVYFEAIIAPPSVPVPRILVNESISLPSDEP